MLFLLGTGIIIKQIFNSYDYQLGDMFSSSLELLGIVGLMMIVLEAAVELDLNKKKYKIIRKSLLLAFLVLVISSVAIGSAIMYFLKEPFFNSLIYAIPVSVVSSAVLIPSLHTLSEEKKEFLVYESTFSDIIGIMFFNFVVISNAEIFTASGFMMILLTLVSSLVLSYIMVYVFSRINSKIKIFLIISILALLFALGKQLHLSSLLMIFIFGIVLNNAKRVFIGPLARLLPKEGMKPIIKDFHIITAETAFVVRTFFFVAFGMIIDLNQLFQTEVLIVGSSIVLILYIIRYLNFKIFTHTDVFPEIFLAPRGLITILLFFQIPEDKVIAEFGVGVLFFVILATGIIMMIALMTNKSENLENFTVLEFGFNPTSESSENDASGKFSEYDDL
ncbi:cation:proton antiporter [Candidatus Kapabacteria bacterium]|nr:cation:proton antiporter [Candidatus Kapabacteria bacterium]